uniref:Uncharacterized protein n=1 Tax=Knipowitschia caucasica TaxID=637954 RepID=A0AAV2JDX8_KNICA
MCPGGIFHQPALVPPENQPNRGGVGSEFIPITDAGNGPNEETGGPVMEKSPARSLKLTKAPPTAGIRGCGSQYTPHPSLRLFPIPLPFCSLSAACLGSACDNQTAGKSLKSYV